MLTGEIRSQIDRIWNEFWTGGISNPLEVIEQITYLLFLKRLDDLHTLEENKSRTLRKPMERHVFPKGSDSIVLGGDVNATYKFGVGFKATVGVRAESSNLLVSGGEPRVAGFGSISKQINENLSVNAEAIVGAVGPPTVSASFAGPNSGTVVFGVQYRR